MALLCPLCTATLSEGSLEAHLRYELLLPAFRCLLCPQTFCDRGDAEGHFAGPLAQHPDSQPRLIQPPTDPAKARRLVEILRLARGGEAAVQQRLCVCGQCHLLCREDFRPTSEAPAESFREAPVQWRKDSPWEESKAPEASFRSQQMPSESAQEEPRLASLPAPSQPEASEEEAAAPMDVKPSLAELKPQLVTDGRVACLQCGHRVDKNNFSNHVQRQHMPGNQFQCLLCPANAKQRSLLASHVKREHGAEAGPETISGSVDKALVREWIGLCFGEAKDVEYHSRVCLRCDKRVRSQDVKPHLARHHLRKTLHQCRRCEFASLRVAKSEVATHVRKAHKLQPGPDTVDSSGMDKYAPILSAMIPQFFEQ